MLTVISRNKVFFIILGIFVLITLVWLLLSTQSNGKVPSNGVFVYVMEGGS
jgi:hypothetical protein